MPRGPVRPFGTSLGLLGTGNGSVSVGNTTAFHASIATTVTVAGWIKPLTRRGTIFNKRAGSGGSYRRFALEHTTTTSPVRFYVENTTGTGTGAIATAPDATATPTGAWTHVAGTYNGSFVGLYINGVKVAQTALTGAIRQDNNQVTIGSFASGSTIFGGLLDELSVWTVALSDTQIAMLYDHGIFPPTGLLARYDMDEGTGTTLTDRTGNGYNGTINGGTWSSDVAAAPRTPSVLRPALHDFRASLVSGTSVSNDAILDPSTTPVTWLGWAKCGAFNGNTLGDFRNGSAGDCVRLTAENTTGHLFVWVVDAAGTGATDLKPPQRIPFNQ